jgi:hypothetical protein
MGSKSHLATRLLKLRVDEVEVKFRVATVSEDGKPLTVCAFSCFVD